MAETDRAPSPWGRDRLGRRVNSEPVGFGLQANKLI